MVPRAVPMKFGLVSVNTARQVNTAHSKTTVNAARPMSYFSKTTHSTVKTPIHKNTSFKNSNINQRVNTARDNFNAVKASACWVWKPKTKVLDHVFKHNNASITLKKFDYVNAQGRSKAVAGYVEHLVSLSLPSDLPRHCLAQGYTHIHFGAIRLAITFHGRKGLPAYSQIALLDASSQSPNPDWWHTLRDALLIDVDSNATLTCTYVPRQLSLDDLVKLLPEKWITNYEQIHQAPVRSTSPPEFVRRENGLVEIKFSSLQPKSENVFPTGIHMITLTDQEPAQEVKHIWWDVCNYKSCLDEAAKINDDEDLPKKQKSSQQKLKRRYGKGDPTVGLLGEPSGKFDYYVLYLKAEPSQPLSPPHKTPPSPHKPPPTSPPPPKLSPYNQKALSILHQDSSVFPITKDPSCSYSQEYEQEFPALTAFEHLDSHTKHDWKIKKPNNYWSNWACNYNQSR
ncbi:hypothetical protein Tco_0134959 [Tanacetum coccineum]